MWFRYLRPFELIALHQPLLDVRHAGRRQERRHPVLVRDDAVEGLAGGEMAGPADEGRDAVGAFPVRVLLAAERRRAGIRPGIVVRAVVGRVQDDGVVGDAEVVEQLQEARRRARRARPCRRCTRPVRTCRGVSAFTCVRKCMRVPFHQQKKGLSALHLPVDEVLGRGEVSSSIVSIRFLVSGPVSSIVWPPLPSALHLSTPRGPNFSRKSCRWQLHSPDSRDSPAPPRR